MLADFGIARDVGQTHGLTATNVTVGTVNYASPEQLTGTRLDGRADQYSLAATAYHLLSGAPMFGSSNAAVVIGQHLNAPPPRLGDFRPALARLDPVLAKALSKNPDDRFRTCTDFADALRQALGGHAGPLPGRACFAGAATGARTTDPAHGDPARTTHRLPARRDFESEGFEESTPEDVTAPSRWPWLLAAGALVMIPGALIFAVWPRHEKAAPVVGGHVDIATAHVLGVDQHGTGHHPDHLVIVGTHPGHVRHHEEPGDRFLCRTAGNARTAWNDLDTYYQQRNGFDDYLGFWSTIESVSVLSVTLRDADSVVATIRYVLKDGRVDTENRWLSVVPGAGKLLIRLRTHRPA